LLLDFEARELGVAIRVEQTLLGGQTGALPIHVNGAAFQHEGCSVPIGSLEFQHLLRDFIIAIPGEVQATVKSAPGIESPVNAAPTPLGVDDEGRPAVANPCVIAADFDDAHLARQLGARILKLRRRDADCHRLSAGDGRGDHRKCRLSRFGPSIQQPEWRSNSAGMRKPSFAGVEASVRNADLRSRMLALRPNLQER